MLAGLLATGLLACGGETEVARPDAAAQVVPAPPLEPLVGGCFGLTETAGCRARAGEPVRVWVDDPEPPAAALYLDEALVAEAAAPVAGGHAWETRLEAGASGRLRLLTAEGEEAWALAVDTGGDALRELALGGLARCGAELPPRPPLETAYELSGLSRCLLGQGQLANACAVMHGVRGLLREQGDRPRFAREAALLVNVQRFAAEPRCGDGSAPLDWELDELSLEGQYDWFFQFGTLAQVGGNQRDAVALLGEAERRAVALGDAERVEAAVVERANAYAASGRHDEALALAAGLVASGEAGSCARAGHLAALSWHAAAALEAGRSPEALQDPLAAAGLAGPEGLLQAAEAALASAPEGCRYAETEPWNLLVNGAVLDLALDDPAAARARLAEAGRTVGERSLEDQDWHGLLSGRAALRAGAPAEALAAHEAVLARHTEVRTLRSWLARLGRAEALAALRREEAALTEYERAWTELTDLARAVGLQEGRGEVLAELARAALAHAELLLARGEAAEALALLRRARRQHLYSLQQPELQAALGTDGLAAWGQLRERAEARAAGRQALRRAPGAELARAEARLRELSAELDARLDAAASAVHTGPEAPLRPPAPGELMVLLAPLSTGWVALLATEAGVASVPLGALELSAAPEVLGPALLGPLEPWLAEAEVVTLLPLGAVRGLDLGALPTPAGERLGSRVPVRTSLDLGAAPPAAARLGRVAVVADPSGNLPSARTEGAAVARAHADRTEVRQLLGRQAERRALVAELSQVDLLHFAGHASFRDDGWDAALLLARGEELSTADILVAEAVPPVVIMAACESSRSREAAIERLGLAQAFLVAGAQHVVAVDAPVPDALALAFSEGLHGALAAWEPLERAFEAGVDAARAVDPEGPWRELRHWVR